MGRERRLAATDRIVAVIAFQIRARTDFGVLDRNDAVRLALSALGAADIGFEAQLRALKLEITAVEIP
ncbi:hypothetical protein SDC9_154309 [bioreactor metagenome]|uniref:Uncharacterized protein n=1 Tax=bioreactor metagenome TaxID=1076179 RepID=A0A645EZY3_9ZZZZ